MTDLATESGPPARLKKPAVLVTGRHRSGKTALINLVLGRAPGRNRAEVESGTDSPWLFHETRLADFYELKSPGPPVRRADLERLRHELEERDFHLAWHCLDVGRGRPNRLDRAVINLILERGLPLALLLTKTDLAGEAEADDLAHLVSRRFPGTPVFEIPTDAHLGPEPGSLGRLVAWSLGQLGGDRRAALAGAARPAVAEKVRLGEECASRHGLLAALAGLSPLPMLDLAVLVPVQAAMLSRLALIWNLAEEKKEGDTPPKLPLSETLPHCASTLGRMLAGNLLKLWPGAGMLAGSLINAAVAGLLTWGLGRAVNRRCEDYARRASAGPVPPLADLMDVDALAPVLELCARAWDTKENDGQ